MTRTSRRIRLGVVVVLTTGALAAAPALASVAQPRTAVAPAASSASSSPAGAAPARGRVPTALHGWAAAPRSVPVHHRFTAPVRVSGGSRIVRLERRVAGTWRLVDRERTTAAGRAVLTWRPATTRAHVVLRVQVPATATSLPVRSKPRSVAVTRPASVPVPASTPRAAAPAPPSATPSTPAPAAAPSAAAASTAVSTSVASSAADDALRAELLALVNRARATPRTCGSVDLPSAPALSGSTALDAAATGWAVRMATEGFFAHESPDGSTMVTRLQAVGVRDTAMRENIAAGQPDAQAVMTAWLQSPGHCANLMAADVTRIGFGHAMSTGTAYGQYWVQDLAG